MSAVLVEKAPAKINLTLRVLGRRADGYHRLESLVAFADLADTLSLQPGGDAALDITGPFAAACGPVAGNLVLKALAALRERVAGLNAGRFVLEKNIPVAAGLGGGSADAAAALRLLAREAGGSMRDAERMLETAMATAPEQVTEAAVASSLGVASRTTVLKLADAILEKNAAAALAHVRELKSRGANLESLGRDLLETFRNLAVAKLPASDADSPLDDIPDHEVTELKRLAAGASSRDIMRLFRLMADSQEQILRSPYPDLLLEMAVVRMASLAAVIDADELLRAIGSDKTAAPPSSGTPPAPSGGGASSLGAAKPEASSKEQPSGARRLRVEGEVKADAPLRHEVQDDSPRELPELRDFIRGRRAALAGFMEQGAGLALDGDLLTVTARNDIYVRYLNDNKLVIAELASEHLGRAIRVELATNGAAKLADAGRVTIPLGGNGRTRELPSAAAADTTNKAAIENAQKAIARSKPVESTRETAPTPPAMNARLRAATPEERQAVLADPAVRRVFDTLDARLVELRIPNLAPASAKEGGGPEPK